VEVWYNAGMKRIPRPRFSPAQRSELLDQLERRSGTIAEFAAGHGISPVTLFRWLRERQRVTVPNDGKALSGNIPFQPVSLGQWFGAGGPWAGEVQLPDGTQVRWGTAPTSEVLLQVLACLRRSC
jgi:Transposase